MILILRPLLRAKYQAISLIGHNMQEQVQHRGAASVPEKLKRAQKLFQEKNNLPVFLKGGYTDRILYYTTLGLAGLGLLSDFALFAGYIID